MKVLVVDDEKLIRDVIKEYCFDNKYDVIEAENGVEAVEKAGDADIIIMDIMMPKMDGFSAYKVIKQKYNVPTIMLSARGEEYDILAGFDLGIDDYMTKPFSPKELLARMNAVLKRYKGEDDFFVYKDLKVDFLGHAVYINGEQLPLTPKEYDLLVYFINNKGIALSREQLLNNIWNYDYFGNDRTIDTHIKMLRNNLKEYRDLITTVRGMGYKFEIKE
jgi:two-component system, OmpR family, response regulator ResD